jgi:multiple sugar transport system substrate-binding protein
MPFARWRSTCTKVWQHSLLAALLLFAWQGAGAAGRAPPAPVIITAWTHSDPLTQEYALIKKSADAFNLRQRAYRVEFVSSLRRDYANWVHREAANGTLPCLLDFDGPFLAEFAWPQYFQPIDSFVPQAMLDDFLPSIVAQGSYQGRLYSLGQFESGLVLWGNLRYLRAAGVRIATLDAPWSLAEFEQALASLAALKEVAYPINFAFYNSRADEFFSYGYAPMMQSFGGDLIERRTLRKAKGVLDGPRSVDAIGHLKRWIAAGWTTPFDQPTDLATGKVALSWNGHWNYQALLKALGPDCRISGTASRPAWDRGAGPFRAPAIRLPAPGPFSPSCCRPRPSWT